MSFIGQHRNYDACVLMFKAYFVRQLARDLLAKALDELPLIWSVTMIKATHFHAVIPREWKLVSVCWESSTTVMIMLLSKHKNHDPSRVMSPHELRLICYYSTLQHHDRDYRLDITQPEWILLRFDTTTVMQMCFTCPMFHTRRTFPTSSGAPARWSMTTQESESLAPMSRQAWGRTWASEE